MKTEIVPDDTGGFNVRVTDGARYCWLGNRLRGDIQRNLVDDQGSASCFETRTQAQIDVENWLSPGCLARMTAEEWERYLDAFHAEIELAGKKMSEREY